MVGPFMVADSTSAPVISVLGGRFIALKKMTRSLVSRCASERIVIFESMKITLARIDTELRWNWHIHLSLSICMACMGKSRRGATPQDWPCIIHRISVERPEILNNKNGLERFFRSNPAASFGRGVRGYRVSSRYLELTERKWDYRPLVTYSVRHSGKGRLWIKVLNNCFSKTYTFYNKFRIS